MCHFLSPIARDKPLFTFHVQQWLDNSPATPDDRSLSPHNNSDLSSSGGSPPLSQISAPIAVPNPANFGEDEVIPTAIVIKNIPFNVKRETLLDIIVRPLSHFKYPI
jgi:hypothetical protein